MTLHNEDATFMLLSSFFEIPNEFLSFQSIYKWSITFLCIRSTNHKFLNGWEFPRPFFLPLKIKNCSTNLLISIYTPNLSVIACRCLHIISRTDVNDKEGGGHLEELDSSPPPLKPLSLQVNTQPLTCDNPLVRAHIHIPPLNSPPSRSAHIPRDNPFLDMIKGVDTQRRFC